MPCPPFSHNFPFPNARCLKCGINQQDLSKTNPFQKEIKTSRYLHSDIHLLADEISSCFNEKSRFGMYLGIIKRIGTEEARRIFSYIKQEKPQNPAKTFLFFSRKKDKRS